MDWADAFIASVLAMGIEAGIGPDPAINFALGCCCAFGLFAWLIFLD